MKESFPRHTFLDQYAMDHGRHGYLRSSHCGYRYQEEVLLPFIDSCGLADGATVLDIGAGLGEGSDAIKWNNPELKTIRYDLSFQALAAQAGTRVQGMAPELPFADNSVEAIVCKDVLVHIFPKETFFREMHRVLRPGGHALVISQRDDRTYSSVDIQLSEDKQIEIPVANEKQYLRVAHLLSLLRITRISPPYTYVSSETIPAFAKKAGFRTFQLPAWTAEPSEDWHKQASRRMVYELVKNRE